MVMMLRSVESEMSTQKLVSWVLADRFSYSLVRKPLFTTRVPKSQADMISPSSSVAAISSTIESACAASWSSMRRLYIGSSIWVDSSQYSASSSRQIKVRNSISWARMPGDACRLPLCTGQRRPSGSNL